MVFSSYPKKSSLLLPRDLPKHHLHFLPSIQRVSLGSVEREADSCTRIFRYVLGGLRHSIQILENC